MLLIVLFISWDDEMIAYMRRMGNEKARNFYEKRAPIFWIRPKDYQDCDMVNSRYTL